MATLPTDWEGCEALAKTMQAEPEFVAWILGITDTPLYRMAEVVASREEILSLLEELEEVPFMPEPFFEKVDALVSAHFAPENPDLFSIPINREALVEQVEEYWVLSDWANLCAIQGYDASRLSEIGAFVFELAECVLDDDVELLEEIFGLAHSIDSEFAGKYCVRLIEAHVAKRDDVSIDLLLQDLPKLSDSELARIGERVGELARSMAKDCAERIENGTVDRSTPVGSDLIVLRRALSICGNRESAREILETAIRIEDPVCA